MFKAKQKMHSILLVCLAMLATVILGFGMLFSTPQTTASAETNGSYVKVTTAPTDWTGKYLIVYETGTTAYVFNGVDATNAYYKATTDGSSIAYDANISTYEVEITKNGSNYYIKSCNGYIGQTSNANGIKIQSSALSNTITFKSASEITIVSGGAYLRFNATSGQYRFRYYKSSSYTGQKAIVLYKWTEASSEPACDHDGTDFTWAYDPNTKAHFQQCECGEEIEGTKVACSEFNYGEYTTENGTHTRTATCTVCGGEQTESGACAADEWSEWSFSGEGKHSHTGNCATCGDEMSETAPCEIETADYVREGNTHSQTGTCSICGESTTVTEDCTLAEPDYEALEADDKEDQQHAKTTHCSVCEKDATEHENCSFDDGVLNGTILTYTCEYCQYSYTEEATMYTVTYVVPNGIVAPEAVEVADGYSTTLSTAETVEGYTFVGWATEEVAKTEIAPSFEKAATEYTVTADVTFYALYSYAEGSGAYTIVKDVADLAVGKEIVIVASGNDYALGADKGNNRNAATITKDGDTVTINSDVQIITLEAGKVANTFAFNVGTGYLYAASSSSNQLKTKDTLDNNGSWLISIANRVATITAQGSNTRNLMRYNPNNGTPLFACYASGQNDVSIYMKDGATYYVTEFNTCAHENTEEVVEEATCTESGSRVVTCLDCEAVIESEILEAPGHKYVDGICQNENCGKQDPASIVYDGYYYLSVNGKYAGEKDKDYYKLFDSAPETVDLAYVFYFVKNGNSYDLYNKAEGLIANNVTIETQEDYTVHITNSDDKILSHNTSYTTYQRLGFYAASNSYPCNIILTEVELPADIGGASLTVKEDIAVNYKVTLSDAMVEGTVMYFTIGETVIDVPVSEATMDSGRYVFSINLGPQYMTAIIKAELKNGDTLLDAIEEYSIQQYAKNKLSDENSSAELKQLVSDMLRYGAAAQIYKEYETDNLATSVDGLVYPSEEALAAPEFTPAPVNAEGVTQPIAYFTAANVWFDYTNKIMVKINTTENVTLKINTVEVAVEGTTIYTEDIVATDFDKEFVFELYYDGTLMQTLTYSVNAYAYKKQNTETAMGKLAIALYQYGASAEAYNS